VSTNDQGAQANAAEMKEGSAHAPHSVPADAGAWFGNVATSVLIVFVNKMLMSSTGYKFQFGELASVINEFSRLYSATRLSLTCLLAHCWCCCSNNTLCAALLVSSSVRQYNAAPGLHKQSANTLER
jgi:hypothetical protein